MIQILDGGVIDRARQSWPSQRSLTKRSRRQRYLKALRQCGLEPLSAGAVSSRHPTQPIHDLRPVTLAYVDTSPVDALSILGGRRCLQDLRSATAESLVVPVTAKPLTGAHHRLTVNQSVGGISGPGVCRREGVPRSGLSSGMRFPAETQ